MTATTLPAPRRNPLRRVVRALADGIHAFWSGITAVSAKELRGRMRGRRAFVVVTIYLLLLSGFAFGIYWYLRQSADLLGTTSGGALPPDFQGKPQPLPDPGFGVSSGLTGTALSATVGHAIFSGLLVVETIMVLVLAPAFTSGLISLEREKQTLDLLVATPLSTLGMVLGKLLSALTWVFLLILASIPLAALVFAFGGVGPEDLVRGYLLLFALAFGMGAIGLFISALVRRTQTATVLTFIAVLVLTLGSMAVHEFWRVAATSTATAPSGFIPVQAPARPPEALLWLNPLVGDADLICTTAPGGYQRETCDYVAAVTGTPFFGATSSNQTCPPGAMCAEPARDGIAIDPPRRVPVAIACPPNARCVAVAADGAAVGQALPEAAAAATSFGFPRDTFWPQSALAFLAVGVVLTLLSAQLVAPTRRLGFLRRLRRSGSPSGEEDPA